LLHPLSTDLEAAMALNHERVDKLSSKWRIKKILGLECGNILRVV
jgi:hypothetical protein